MLILSSEGILWITANNIYFSCESCKLLLPMREIENITRSKGLSRSGHLDSIQLNTEDGTVPPFSSHAKKLPIQNYTPEPILRHSIWKYVLFLLIFF